MKKKHLKKNKVTLQDNQKLVLIKIQKIKF